MPKKTYKPEEIIGKLRDELLNGEVFTTLNEAQVLIGNWREHYNRYRPHSALGYCPPAPETWHIPDSSMPLSSFSLQ